eukprot:CAMPEP_0185041578 /NCGR_PEP_ID=MMETSP1103-20130426/41073_1 /TAXON_ID=36769 /ORGANISM="Paraphysomonas bandaiensis, Strain Caron Lab Isolate" /LENGTH=417 /DNA_ID=CAMNT_0027581379 /DNA_START=297 /DNA_END=1550 /DNA_ORIENTATION=-
MARAEALHQHSILRISTSSSKGYNSISTTEDSEVGNVSSPMDGTDWVVGEKKFEITELCAIFLGVNGMRAFSFVLAVYLYGTLWAYGTVFANSLTASFDIGEWSYYIYLLFYAAIVIPTSCLELTEQITLQVIYAACRVIMVLLMVGSVLLAYYHSGEVYRSPDIDDAAPLASPMSNLWDHSGLRIIIPIALFANIFHHSIPALSEPTIDKKQLSSIYASTLLCCYIAYTLIGVTLSLYFGDSIMSSSNLNWMDYDGGIAEGEVSRRTGALLVQLVSSYIIVFPAVDVASAFPLCAITLGNNLLSSCCEKGVNSMERSYVIAFRLVSAIPPLIGAACVQSLGTITDYTGITGFFLVFIFPPLLAYFSKKILLERGISPVTFYSTSYTSDACGLMLGIFGVGVTAYVVGSHVMHGAPE